MRGTYPEQKNVPTPACPNCGSRDRVIRMASSLTPFERPDAEDPTSSRYYCQACSHEFIPEQRDEDASNG